MMQPRKQKSNKLLIVGFILLLAFTIYREFMFYETVKKLNMVDYIIIKRMEIMMQVDMDIMKKMKEAHAA